MKRVEGLNESMQKNGFFIIKNAFPKEKLLEIKTKIEKHLEKEGVERRWGGVSSGLTSIENKNYFKLLESKELFDRINMTLYGSDKKVIPLGAFAHYNIPSSWHTDEKKEYKDKELLPYRVAIYLQNHEDNNQGLWVVPTSHKDFFVKGRLLLLFKKQQYTKTKFGDLIVFDLRLLHRGWKPSFSYYLTYLFSFLVPTKAFKKSYRLFLKGQYSCQKKDKTSLFMTFGLA